MTSPNATKSDANPPKRKRGRPPVPPLVKACRGYLTGRRTTLEDELGKVAVGEDYFMMQERLSILGIIDEGLSKVSSHEGQAFVHAVKRLVADWDASLNRDLVKEHREEYAHRIEESISELQLIHKSLCAVLRKEGLEA